ncbi:MAG: hypothetical protein LUF33_05020 [Clostridiales bacterium]|nr:hypothetical protein [Clostridiales bacterium]
MNLSKKLLAGVTAAIMMVSAASTSAFAAETSDLDAGTYTVDSELSLYVNAMGGIEFADDLYKSTEITVDESGNAYATLNFYHGTGEFSIYTVSVYHFINADKSAPGFYESDGTLNTTDITYTLSEASDTLPDSNGNEYQYVTSITVPVEVDDSEVYLWLYVDSQIMGCQFGDGSGNAASNTPGETTPCEALLTIDWDTLTAGSSSGAADADETSSASANVTYTATVEDTGDSYEVAIPESIVVDPSTKEGTYTVEASDFDLADGAYVEVSADTSGTLSDGTNLIAFSNALESVQLTKTGDSANGTVTVTEDAPASGTYTGTLDFAIYNYAAD